MSQHKDSSPLVSAIARFIDHRRTLGYACRNDCCVLQSLQRHVEQCGVCDLDACRFESWLANLQSHHPNTRRRWHQIVHRFCIYRQRSESGCFVPSIENLPKRHPSIRPIILEPEHIVRMLGVASNQQRSNSPLRSSVLRLAVVLLYTCGLRLGELLKLRMGDIENDDTVLRIRESKFHKSRLVPLSPSATRELRAYLKSRRKAFASAPSAPLLCNGFCGWVHPYSAVGLRCAINQLFDAAGIRDEFGRRPRVHDMRHTFAVQALIRWYRSGADVQSCLPKLALYMGHVSILSSAYYLHWVPALQSLASDRYEKEFGHLIHGDIQ